MIFLLSRNLFNYPEILSALLKTPKDLLVPLNDLQTLNDLLQAPLDVLEVPSDHLEAKNYFFEPPK